jgi:uncharacterized cupin superfamily protein
MSPFMRSAHLAALCLLAAACATVRQTENIGPNDPAALAAIRAAYMKAGEQKSFRARMHTESEGKLSEGTIQFAAPGSMHMVMKTQNQTMEHIVTGGAHYVKADGKWTRLPFATGNMMEQFRKDPATLAAFERTVSGAQVVGPDMVGSQRATAYRYYQAASIGGGLASSAGWVKVWVGSNGLPLKVESDASGRVLGFGGAKSKTTIFYDDYGVPVRIVAPI